MFWSIVNEWIRENLTFLGDFDAIQSLRNVSVKKSEYKDEYGSENWKVPILGRKKNIFTTPQKILQSFEIMLGTPDELDFWAYCSFKLKMYT